MNTSSYFNPYNKYSERNLSSKIFEKKRLTIQPSKIKGKIGNTLYPELSMRSLLTSDQKD